MSNQDIITASCIILQQEDAFRNTIFSTLKYFSLTDYFLLQNMRRSSEEMARVGHYYEITIPSYIHSMNLKAISVCPGTHLKVRARDCLQLMPTTI